MVQGQLPMHVALNEEKVAGISVAGFVSVVVLTQDMAPALIFYCSTVERPAGAFPIQRDLTGNRVM